MRTTKPYNDEGFEFVKMVRKSTKDRTGTMLVRCPKCHSTMIVCVNSYYRNRIRCACEIHHKRLFSIYTNMKTRCYNKNNPGYRHYGSRGVVICQEWLEDFNIFYEWAMSNGYSDDLTIDRIDVDGNYEPSNCRWVTQEEQAGNKSNTVRVNGTSLRKWCVEHGLNYKTVHTYKTRHPDKSITEIVNKYLELEGEQNVNL